MLRFFNAVKGALTASEGKKKEPESYQSWVAELSHKILEPLLPLFCALKDEGSVPGETRKSLLKGVCEVLDATDELLHRPTSIPVNDEVEDSDAVEITEAKQVLLELWYHLLGCLTPVPTANVSPSILRAITVIVRRPEFSMRAFLSVNNGSTCPQHQLCLAQRYRRLLCSTFRYIAAVLSATAIPKDECLSPISPFFFKINGLLYPCSDLFSPVLSPGSSSPGTSVSSNVSSLTGAERFSLDSVSADGSSIDDCSPTFEHVAMPDESHPQVLGLSLIDETRDSIRKGEGGSSEDGNGPRPGAEVATPTYSQLTPQFQVFAAQMLAVVFWRIPVLQSDILCAATKKTEDATSTVVLPESAPFIDAEQCPLLLRWGRWHRALREVVGADDGEFDQLRSISKRWLWHISRHHAEFFVAFFLEWLLFTRRALGEVTNEDISQQKIDWRRIPGYSDLTRAFLSVFAQITLDIPGAKEMERAELELLTTIPPVIMNAYTKLLYHRTRLSEIPSLVNAVLTLDSWLAELTAKQLTIGDDFDMDYFCKGLDYILQTDQHLILSRLLAMIYNYSRVFVGKNRLVLFGHLLLEQHFYHLFCHWDDNVRLIYNQVLLFTMLCTKQSQLIPASAKNVPNKNKAVYSQNAWSIESIDTLLYAKIEAYVKTVTDYVAERRAAIQAAQNPSRMSISRLFSGRKSMSQAEKPRQPIKKNYVFEEVRIPIIEEDPVSGKPSIQIRPPTPPLTPALPIPKTAEMLMEVNSKTQAVVVTPTVPTNTTTTTTTTSPSSVDDHSGDRPVVHLLEPTPVSLPGEMPQNLKIYAVRACEDYRRHLARYKEWETRGFSQVPRLLTMV